MLQEVALPLAEVPADEDDFTSSVAAPCTDSMDKSIEHAYKRPKVSNNSDRYYVNYAENSLPEEPAAAPQLGLVIASSEHERILAEFCMNEEDNGGIEIPPESISPNDSNAVDMGLTTTEKRAVDLEKVWQEKMNALIQYGIDKGNCNIPYHDIYEYKGEVYSLGVWVTKQRAFHKQNKLPPERRKAFETLAAEGKFRWDLHGELDCIWYCNYAALMEFKRVHGHCNPPWNYVHTDEDGNKFNIGEWVTTQRKLARENKHTGDHAVLISVMFYFAFHMLG